MRSIFCEAGNALQVISTVQKQIRSNPSFSIFKTGKRRRGWPETMKLVARLRLKMQPSRLIHIHLHTSPPVSKTPQKMMISLGRYHSGPH